MDHSYGVMQDSGISSPSQPEMGRAWGKHVLVVQEAGGHMFVKEEPQEISRGTYSSMPHLLDYTEEVETSAAGLVGDRMDSRKQMCSPSKLNYSSSQHDSGVADVSSLTPGYSSGSASSLRSASCREQLSSPMDIFVPNATSTPEDDFIVVKREHQSPTPQVCSASADLRRCVLLSGMQRHSPNGASVSQVSAGDRQVVTPEFDCSHDMSHMAVPGDGYFSRENLRSVQTRVSRNLHAAHMNKGRRRIHTPHAVETTPPAQAVPFSYLPPQQRERTPSPSIAPIPRLNLDGPEQDSQDSMDSIQEGRTPVNILKVEPHTVGTPDGEKMIIQIPALKPRCHGPPRGAGGEGHQLSNVTLKLRPSSAFGSLDQMNAAQKHSTAAEYSAVSDNTPSGIIARGFDPGPKDDSLTNIHWLKNMSSAGFVPNTSPQVPVGQGIIINSNHILLQRQDLPQDVSVVDSDKHIKKIAEECGKTQRPPYAYMHLIQMAIKSYPQQRATLKQIYTWIENTFPYYKHTEKKGWKNSIRHNLSLYNIFIRKRSSVPGATGGSYWTLQPGIKPMPKSRFGVCDMQDKSSSTANRPIAPSVSTSFQASTNSAFTPITSSNNPTKRGPTPLLPKPPTMQSYTIIPLPTEGSLSPSVLGSHAIVVTADQVAMATSNGCLDTETIQAVNSLISTTSESGHSTASAKVCSLKRSTSCEPGEGPRRKQVKTGPLPSILTRRRPSAQLGSSLDTSDLMQQMSRMKFENSVNESRMDYSSHDSQDGDEHSIPRPPTRRKPRKEKIRYRVDSSEKSSDCDGREGVSVMTQQQLHRIRLLEEDLSSPVRSLLITPPQDVLDPSVKTSTPSKDSPSTPDSWISPIHGFTPLNEDNILMGMDSLLNVTPNSKVGGASKGHQEGVSPGSTHSSPGIGSLRDFGLPGLTPLKPTHHHNAPDSPLEHSPNTSFTSFNLSKYLGDIGDDINAFSLLCTD